MLRLTKIYSVLCDDCGCSHGEFPTKRDAVLSLTRDVSWLRIKGKAYCPICASNHLDEKPKLYGHLSPRESYIKWYSSMMADPERKAEYLERKRQRRKDNEIRKIKAQ